MLQRFQSILSLHLLGSVSFPSPNNLPIAPSLELGVGNSKKTVEARLAPASWKCQLADDPTSLSWIQLRVTSVEGHSHVHHPCRLRTIAQLLKLCNLLTAIIWFGSEMAPPSPIRGDNSLFEPQNR